MAKPTDSHLEDLFKQASEIAQQVPDHLQEAAFNKAIDLLTGAHRSEGSAQEPDRTVNRPSRKSRSKQSPSTVSPSKQQETAIESLLLNIDSTKHPEILASKNVLERSLWVLQLAHRDHGVDGLSPKDIAKTLTGKFRVRTTDAAVRMALGKASNLVDRVPQGKGFIYRIMAPGEEYLSQTDSEKHAAAENLKSRPKSKGKKRGRGTKPASATVGDAASESRMGAGKSAQNRGTGNKKARKSSTVGPKAAVQSLIDEGYFDEGRLGPEVQVQLKKKRGLQFGVDQLRMTMLRLVREQKLERDENAEGQYEYKKT